MPFVIPGLIRDLGQSVDFPSEIPDLATSCSLE